MDEVLTAREPLYQAAATVSLAVDTVPAAAVAQRLVDLVRLWEAGTAMSGNTFGKIFRLTTWGESHGPALGAVIDGCPPRLPLTAADIDLELARRRPGSSIHTTSRREPDKVEILSGVFQGQTTGTPISLIIFNQDVKSEAYEPLKDIFRPGHGDFTYQAKYGIRDHRGGGRASARETAARVAAGAVAQKILDTVGLKVISYTLELGGIRARQFLWESLWENPFFCPDPDAAAAMASRVQESQKTRRFFGRHC